MYGEHEKDFEEMDEAMKWTELDGAAGICITGQRNSKRNS